MASAAKPDLATPESNSVSRGKMWASWIITGLVTAFLLLDVAVKFAQPAAVLAGFARSGWPIQLSSTLGVILLVCTALWLIPRTAVLGAILLTGYLGGAVASNLRLESPLFSNTLFPVYFGVLIWGALWLRDARIRELMPLRTRL